MTFTFPSDPDYGVWTRAVERVVDALELDFWPTEAHVASLVAEHNLTDPDTQMDALEEELIAELS